MHQSFNIGLCWLVAWGSLFTGLSGCGNSRLPESLVVKLDARYPRADQPLELPIVNYFNETAIVSSFRTSCNCSKPEFEPIEVPAGARVKLPIQLNTTSMATAFPESRFPEGGSVELTPILTSKLDATKSSPGIPIHIAFQFRNSFHLDQSVLYFGLGQFKQRLQIECDPDVAEVQLDGKPDGLNLESAMLQGTNRLVPDSGQIDLLFECDSQATNRAETMQPVTFAAFDASGQSIGQATVAFHIAKSESCLLSRDHFVVDGLRGTIRTTVVSTLESVKISDVHVEGPSTVAISDVRFDASNGLLELSVEVTAVPKFESMNVVVKDSGGQESSIPVSLTFR